MMCATVVACAYAQRYALFSIIYDTIKFISLLCAIESPHSYSFLNFCTIIYTGARSTQWCGAVRCGVWVNLGCIFETLCC